MKPGDIVKPNDRIIAEIAVRLRDEYGFREDQLVNLRQHTLELMLRDCDKASSHA